MTTRFDVVAIIVADMARSLAFYRLLGFDLPPDADREPHVEAVLPGGLRIAWDTIDTIRSFDPEWTPPSGGSRIALAFACDDPADVDATFARLVAAGHDGHLQPWNACWGMRYAVLHDPDGNTIDLFAKLPAARLRRRSVGTPIRPEGGRARTRARFGQRGHAGSGSPS